MCSRRWSWRSPGCISCERRCWTAWSGCRIRSAKRCGSRSGSALVRRRTGFWSAWRCLGLLSEVAEERPLVCLVDDEQWLDRASARALGFVARRLQAESVGLVFAARVPGDEVAGLPELAVDGLARGGRADAAGLGAHRAAGCTRPRPDRRRDAGQSAGAAGAAAGDDAGAAGRRVRAARRDAAVRAGSRRASGGGSTLFRPRPGGCCSLRRRIRPAIRLLVWQAARRLGIGVQAATRCRRGRAWSSSARGCGSGIRWSARRPTGRRRCRSGRTLHARAGGGHRSAADPDRRAWHRAQAAPGPTRTSPKSSSGRPGRAQERGGLAAAAAFLERAALLTPDPGRRAQRLLAAARAKRDAGALDAALGLLVAVEAGPLDALRTAEVEHLRGQIALTSAAAATPPGCCSARPGASSRSTPAWRARRTWRP